MPKCGKLSSNGNCRWAVLIFHLFSRTADFSFLFDFELGRLLRMWWASVCQVEGSRRVASPHSDGPILCPRDALAKACPGTTFTTLAQVSKKEAGVEGQPLVILQIGHSRCASLPRRPEPVRQLLPTGLGMKSHSRETLVSGVSSKPVWVEG